MKLLHFIQASWEIPEKKPDPEWPQEGKVDVKELCLKYRDDLAPALKNISFSINSSEKVKTISQYFANMEKYKHSHWLKRKYSYKYGFYREILSDKVI